MAGITFNCGEFKPGKKIISISPRRLVNPPRIIIKPKGPKPPFGGPGKKPPKIIKVPPGGPDPGGPDPELFKCVDDKPILCPERDAEGNPQITLKPGRERKCRKCTKEEIRADRERNRLTGAPLECVSKAKCEQNCEDIPPVCETPLRKAPGAGISPQPRRPPTNKKVKGGVVPPPGSGPGTIINPGSNAGINPRGGPIKSVPKLGIDGEGRLDRGKSPGFKSNISAASLAKSKDRNKVILDVEEEASLVSISHSQDTYFNKNDVYHPVYTVYNYDESRDTMAVDNYTRLDVFDKVVAEEVKYILDRSSGGEKWHEASYTKLSNDLIAFSLKEELLTAFNNIYNIDNSKIPLNHFLELVKRLLIEGRLDEFDPYYFINLSQTQEGITELEVLQSQDRALRDRFALGALSRDAQPADPDRHSEEMRESIKRFRPLLTEIELGFTVDYFVDGELVTSVVDAEEQGIPLETTGGGSTHIPLGDGQGYYLDATNVDLVEVPLKGTHKLDLAYYVPADVRELFLKQLGFPSEYSFSVTSTPAAGEFEADANTHVGDIGYFILDNTSVGRADSDNDFIYNATGTYNLETDQDVIDQHTRNNGANVTRACVDYRDYFHEYAMESGSMELSMYDVNYEMFESNRTTVGNQILIKHLPAAIVLCPGKGTKHNPFGEFSELLSFRDVVRREIKFMPALENGDRESAIDKNYVGNVEGNYYIGLVEKQNPETQSILYQYDPNSSIFNNSYYSNNQESSTTPSRPVAAQRAIINVIEDVLKLRYNISSKGLTWWDIIRRLSAKDYFALRYHVPKSFYNAISNGWRGVKVREVLNRADTDIETGLLSIKNSSIEDTIILNTEDRDAQNN